MWDWTASKNPPSFKNFDEEEDDLLDEGQSPIYPSYYGSRKDPRIVPYKDPKEVSSAEAPDDVSIDAVAQSARKEALRFTAKGVPSEKSNTLTPALVNAEQMYASNPEPSTYAEAENESDIEVWQGEEVSSSVDETNDEQVLIKNADIITPRVVDVNDDAGIWEWQFSMFNLPSMSLMEVMYQPTDINKKAEFRRLFKRIRRDFLRYIAYYNQAELEAAGVDEKGLRNLKKGKAPENYDVHLKVPVEYGGTVEFLNLLFIQTHPFHDDIHKFLDMQITSQPFGCKLSRLYVPYTESRVYVPKDSSALGGGKGKGDKTSVQGYSAAALQQMALKSTMDRGAGI